MTVATDAAIGDRGPLPPELVGLAHESRADPSCAAPPLGYSGQGLVLVAGPVVTPPSGPSGIWGHSRPLRPLLSEVMAADTTEQLHAIGISLVRDGRLVDAEAIYRRLIDVAPEDPRIRMALAVVLLTQGKYREAWPLYEARFEVPGVRPKPVTPWREWKGEPLAGKRMVVFPEQGFGDQIMFARFALAQQSAGADVIILCSRPLVTLFEDAGLRALAAEGEVEFPNPDFWVMSNSLASRSGAEVATLPGLPYLRASASPAAGRIGVVVRGSPHHHNDVNRSLPASVAARLLAIPEAISLAPEDTGAADFAETAKIVASVELIVTVDTSVAHLAGAMGKPTLVLLPWLADWRWMRDRDDSPWYPTARLFRQKTPGDWGSVVERVCRELA